MQPDNAIIGSASVELPQATPDPDVLAEEKKIAKYSKSSEFKRLLQYFESRKQYYQRFLPDGRSIGVGGVPSGADWVIANTLIAEFDAVANFYAETAKAVSDDESARV